MYVNQKELKAALKPLQEKLDRFSQVKQSYHKTTSHIKVKSDDLLKPGTIEYTFISKKHIFYSYSIERIKMIIRDNHK